MKQPPKPSLPKSGGKPPAKRDALVTIVTRNQFYHDGYRMLMRVAFVQGAIILALILALAAFFISNKTEYRFFATTQDGRIIDLVPLDQPYVANNGNIMAWASQAATEAMTFGFHDYRMRLQGASKYFTRRGWEAFVKAITDARILETVEKRQVNVKGSITEAPSLYRQGVWDQDNTYRWIIDMPFTIEYLGGDSTLQPTRSHLVLTITRVPNLQNSTGIAIDSWIQEATPH